MKAWAGSMKIFMIAKNNIKKAKFATATLIILIAMATIFLYVGINVLANMDSFIENKNAELNGAHFVSITDGILNCDFIVDPRMTLLTTISISFLGLVTLFIVSSSIKKISPWKPLAEGSD